MIICTQLLARRGFCCKVTEWKVYCRYFSSLPWNRIDKVLLSLLSLVSFFNDTFLSPYAHPMALCNCSISFLLLVILDRLTLLNTTWQSVKYHHCSCAVVLHAVAALYCHLPTLLLRGIWGDNLVKLLILILQYLYSALNNLDSSSWKFSLKLSDTMEPVLMTTIWPPRNQDHNLVVPWLVLIVNFYCTWTLQAVQL